MNGIIDFLTQTEICKHIKIKKNNGKIKYTNNEFNKEDAKNSLR